MSSEYEYTIEHRHFLRGCQVNVDLYRDVSWDILIKEVPAKDLYRELYNNQSKFKGKRFEAICTLLQEHASDTSISKDDCDVTLLYDIIRHLTSLRPPTQGWGLEPLSIHISITDDVERMRLSRNKLYGHIKTHSLNKTEFKKLMDEAEAIVERVGQHLQDDGSEFKQYLWDIKNKDISNECEERIKELGKTEIENRDRTEENRERIKLLELAIAQYAVNTDKDDSSKRCIHEARTLIEDDERQGYNIKGKIVKKYSLLKQKMDKEDTKMLASALVLQDKITTDQMEDVVERLIPRRRDAVEKLLKHVLGGDSEMHKSFVSECETRENVKVVCDTNLSEKEMDAFIGLELMDDGRCRRPHDETKLTFTYEQKCLLITALNDELTTEVLNDELLSRLCISVAEHTKVWNCDMGNEKRINTLIATMQECNSSVLQILCEILDSLKMPYVADRLTVGPALPIEILGMDGKAIKLYKTALEEGEEVDHSIRIMIVGQFDVGKTTLTRRLLGKTVNINVKDSTNGIDVHMRRCKVSLSDLTWHSLQPDEKSNTVRNRLAKVIASRMTGDAPTPADETILKTTAPKKKSSDGAVKGDEMLNIGENLKTQPISKPSDDKEKEKEEEDDETTSVKEIKALVKSGTLDPGEFASVSLWDFAGQYVFYTTHQFFLSPRAVYLLVTDISKLIDDVVMDDECYFDSSGPKKCTISDFLDFWLNSIHTCSSDGPCDKSTVPPVILVGTHADKLTEATGTDNADSFQREENSNRDTLSIAYFQAVRHHLREKPTQYHLADEDFDIDNTVIDPKLNDLKKKIVEVAQLQPHWGTRIPAKWLPLEAALYGLNEKIIDFVRIEELNETMSVPISTAEELELFLQFHHQSGNILYFSMGSLKEKVVLDSQWLVDALKSLITANEFYSKNPHVMEKWREFKSNGILRPQLLDAVWHKEKNPSFHDNRAHLLALMEKLNLISRPMLWHKDDSTPTTKEYYLAPCMLKEKPPEGILSPSHGEDCETTSILVFYFKRKFLSPAIFHRLLATCLSKWPLWRQGERDRIFCGCGVFEIDQSHKLTLFVQDFTIQAFVTKFGHLEKSPREETCIDVRDFLDNSLTFLTGGIATSPLYKLCIKCPEDKSNSVDAIITVSKLQEEKEVVCSCHDSTDTHVISVDMLKYWFPCNTGYITDDKAYNSCLSTERLRKMPTEKDLAKISQRVGLECKQLGLELGLTEAEIDQIRMDNPFHSKDVIFTILLTWERKVGNATFCCLENAMRAASIDTIKVFKDIDSW